MNRKQKAAVIIVVGALGAVAFAATQQVDNTITPVDAEYLERILGPNQPRLATASSSFAGELASIALVQRRILDVAPVNAGLPKGSGREPKDLYEAKQGLCYDRSRVIEKALRSLGFVTRHVFIYATDGPERFPLFKGGVRSHAVTEVRTREGWMVVDSNFPWLSLTTEGRPVGMKEVQADVGIGKLAWAAPFAGHQNDIYRRPFNYYFGLYSRHGGFYPPFTPFPDLHWGELLTHLE